MVIDAQSKGRERMDLPDIGCEFLEIRMDSITNPHANRKKDAATT